MINITELKYEIIDNAVRHLITGEDIYTNANNKQPMRGTKVINNAIQLQSIEVDTALLMLTKIIRRDKGISADRVFNLLQSDNVGKHLVRIMDEYRWAYHGFMETTDRYISTLFNMKKYSLMVYDLYTGYEKRGYIDSFVIKMKKHEGEESCNQ